jgi:hypothetical protein
MDLPKYDDLPLALRGGRSAWGIFGADDSIGMLNTLTPSVTLAASRLIETGNVISLDLPLDFFDPPLFNRTALKINKKVSPDGQSLDETYENYNPQSSSQWDALGHVAYDTDNFYNGATLKDVLEENRNTIDHWAAKGIATRGVLLDVERLLRAEGHVYDPGSAYAFTVDELERARKRANLEFRQGDVVLIRTGFIEWYKSQPVSVRERISDRNKMEGACGVEHTEDMARYIWNTGAIGIASDCPALEVWPMDRSNAFGRLHGLILGQFGMGIGELWALDRLGDWCEANGRSEFFMTSAPLHARSGVGSPPNALAIL